MATYKTPGVYVEEITKFPPSVAQVETAIPAFIGYTEKAEKRNGDDLTLIPTRITSLLEYETYFGSAKEETTIGVTLTDSTSNGVVNRVIKANEPTSETAYLMHYAMQMYFANGGGPCYIISVADYSSGVVSKGDLDNGLAACRKEDEPTLILFPDAKNMNNTSDFYSLYNDALTQCNELQDRFTIIDTESDDEEFGTPVQDLRDNITSDKDYVKYGAAYYPYLETILDYQYDESNVTITHISDASSALDSVLSDANTALATVSSADSGIAALITAYTDANTTYQGLAAATAFSNKTDVTEPLQDIVDSLQAVVDAGGDAAAAGTAAAAAAEENPTIAGDATTAATAITTATTGGASIVTLISTLEAHIAAIDAAGNGTDAKTAAADATADHGDAAAEITTVLGLIDPTLIDAIIACQGVDTDGHLHGLTLAAIETVDNALYNQIKAEINAMPFKLPPSSAMAGIYARTDANVGVWKAPANTSLNYVIKPSVTISSEDQESLNVDTVAGKSVNAIRTFRGKGTLVWGARTLAGNDNEWRYVPVRRFFNMVEESVSKATEQFVFESNDSNTWVRIRAMIENFLILQWKAGALAGSKPEQAFYVRVGLGQTMTAQDILEGRMIIEIGMAAVRPAEFIILRFSHKMQEA
ncbi:MAG: phage tail sheath subtilisin-like domain-containing protein [bacterium]|nr:phage tail sheath subtilisin-like domain-containing protein [bacterium]